MSLFSKIRNPRKENSNSDPDVPTESSQQPLKSHDILVIAFHGKIYAVHKHDGHRLWRQSFPAGAMGTVVSLFITDQDRLIAASNGKTVAMDLFTGDTLWINKMKGCGYAEVGTVVSPSRTIQPILSSAISGGPPTYTRKMSFNGDDKSNNPVVVSCTEGKCIGIDLYTGEELWIFECLNGGYFLPTTLVNPVAEFYKAPGVYVVCGAMLYYLEVRTGKLQWYTKFTNSKMANGHTTMATLWSSRIAAETATPFTMFPVAQQAAESRQRGGDA